MSGQYTRDHRHDFLVALARAQNELERMSTYLVEEVRPAVNDMDIITMDDTLEMKGRIEDLGRAFGAWKATPFSWKP